MYILHRHPSWDQEVSFRFVEDFFFNLWIYGKIINCFSAFIKMIICFLCFGLFVWWITLICFLIEIQLTYNITLASGVQQTQWSDICIYCKMIIKISLVNVPYQPWWKEGKGISIELTNTESLMRKYYKHLISINMII